MLKSWHRITQNADYRSVVRNGNRCGASSMILYSFHSPEVPQKRFGFIVSKQVGNAVVRNRIRRRLKAICAETLAEGTAGADVVIRALPLAATNSYTDLREDVRRCLQKVK